MSQNPRGGYPPFAALRPPPSVRKEIRAQAAAPVTPQWRPIPPTNQQSGAGPQWESLPPVRPPPQPVQAPMPQRQPQRQPPRQPPPVQNQPVQPMQPPSLAPQRHSAAAQRVEGGRPTAPSGALVGPPPHIVATLPPPRPPQFSRPRDTPPSAPTSRATLTSRRMPSTDSSKSTSLSAGKTSPLTPGSGSSTSGGASSSGSATARDPITPVQPNRAPTRKTRSPVIPSTTEQQQQQPLGQAIQPGTSQIDLVASRYPIAVPVAPGTGAPHRVPPPPPTPAPARPPVSNRTPAPSPIPIQVPTPTSAKPPPTSPIITRPGTGPRLSDPILPSSHPRPPQPTPPLPSSLAELPNHPALSANLTPLERDFAHRHAEMQHRARLLLAELRAISNLASSSSFSASSHTTLDPSQNTNHAAISTLSALLSGRLTTVVSSPPPRPARALARDVASAALDSFDHALALDLLIADLSGTAAWCSGNDKILNERVALLTAALPTRLSDLPREARMHFDRESGRAVYLNANGENNDSIAHIPRERFFVTADGYAWDVRELITTGGGGRVNPITGRALGREDIERLRAHTLGSSLLSSVDGDRGGAHEGNGVYQHLQEDQEQKEEEDDDDDDDEIDEWERDYEDDDETEAENVFSDAAAIEGDGDGEDQSENPQNFLGPVWRQRGVSSSYDFARTRAESVSSMGEGDVEIEGEGSGEVEGDVQGEGEGNYGPSMAFPGHMHRDIDTRIETPHPHQAEKAAPVLPPVQTTEPIRPVWQFPSSSSRPEQQQLFSLNAPGAFPSGGGEDEMWWKIN